MTCILARLPLRPKLIILRERMAAAAAAEAAVAAPWSCRTLLSSLSSHTFAQLWADASFAVCDACRMPTRSDVEHTRSEVRAAWK